MCCSTARTVTSFTLGDGTTTSAFSSPRGQFITASFQETVPGSGLQPVTLEFQAVGAEPNFVLNALDIVQSQNVITLTKTGESFVNGFEVLTLSGQGAAANSLVTLSSSLGTVTADSTGQTVSDADPNYAGIQVRTDASGDFSFAVQTQTPATSGTVSARDVTGVAAGSSNVTITSPVVSYHFDFVNDSGTGNATSPTAPGYLTVLPNTVYQGTTQPYGWQSSGLVSGFNDGTTDSNASPALTPPAFSNNATVNTDLAEAGQAGNSATFDVAVAVGHTYTLTFYLGDALQAHELTIAVSGGSVTIDPQSDGGLITTGTPPPGGNGTLGRRRRRLAEVHHQPLHRHQFDAGHHLHGRAAWRPGRPFRRRWPGRHRPPRPTGGDRADARFGHTTRRCLRGRAADVPRRLRGTDRLPSTDPRWPGPLPGRPGTGASPGRRRPPPARPAHNFSGTAVPTTGRRRPDATVGRGGRYPEPPFCPTGGQPGRRLDSSRHRHGSWPR